MARRTLIERLAAMLAEDESLHVTTGCFSGEDSQWIDISPAKRDYNQGYHICQVLSFKKKGQKLTEVNAYRVEYDIHEESKLIK